MNKKVLDKSSRGIFSCFSTSLREWHTTPRAHLSQLPWMYLPSNQDFQKQRNMRIICDRTLFAATYFSPPEDSAQGVLGIVRQHWSVENGLHYWRVVTWHKDRSRVRRRRAPQVMAVLNKSIQPPAQQVELVVTTTSAAFQHLRSPLFLGLAGRNRSPGCWLA